MEKQIKRQEKHESKHHYSILQQRKTIAHTIESVLAQTYDDIEYWIIDGKSSDGTVALAESYCNAMEQKGIIYHILSEPDGGIYDAMNKGIRLATGDVIGIINSDDWYEPNAVGTAVHTFEKTGCDLMFADIRMYKADGSTFVKKHDCADFRHQETGIIRQRLSKRNCTKSIHFEIKAFMMIMAFLQMQSQKRKIVIVDQILANFHMGGASNHKDLGAKSEKDQRQISLLLSHQWL